MMEQSQTPVAETATHPNDMKSAGTSRWRALRVAGMLLLILLALAGAWFAVQMITEWRRENANRWLALEHGNQETLRQVQQTRSRIDALDARLNELTSQTSSLSADLAGRRDERALADAMQAITLASQQLQFAGNVELSRLALQNAEARLADTGQPRFASLRHLLIRDIARLQAIPGADIPGIAARLESVAAVAAQLPLAFAHRPQPQPATASALPAASGDYWRSLWADVREELRQLIRIERLEHDEPALVSPGQDVFLRENLKLRLLGARLALLQRDGATFQEELRQARTMIERYFDLRAQPVRAALATVKALAAIDIGTKLPTLDETLAAANTLARQRTLTSR
jgi:uroporphyrin-3 C-methyltransferase